MVWRARGPQRAVARPPAAFALGPPGGRAAPRRGQPEQEMAARAVRRSGSRPGGGRRTGSDHRDQGGTAGGPAGSAGGGAGRAVGAGRPDRAGRSGRASRRGIACDQQRHWRGSPGRRLRDTVGHPVRAGLPGAVGAACRDQATHGPVEGCWGPARRPARQSGRSTAAPDPGERCTGRNPAGSGLPRLPVSRCNGAPRRSAAGPQAAAASPPRGRG
jgi:hypothetical protein